MELEHHPLTHKFAGLRDVIHKLKLDDPEFNALMKRYEDIDKEIYRIEQDIQPTVDHYLEILKKKRVFLRDKLYDMLRENS